MSLIGSPRGRPPILFRFTVGLIGTRTLRSQERVVHADNRGALAAITEQIAHPRVAVRIRGGSAGSGALGNPS